MITTLNIDKISDLDNDLIIKMLKDMFNNYGEIELVIKPKNVVSNDILTHRYDAVEKGEKLLTFSDDEFEELNNNLLKGKKPDKLDIKRIRKNEKTNIISE